MHVGNTRVFTKRKSIETKKKKKKKKFIRSACLELA